jgi:polar amino acid transport system substrate-binding protein
MTKMARPLVGLLCLYDREILLVKGAYSLSKALLFLTFWAVGLLLLGQADAAAEPDASLPLTEEERAWLAEHQTLRVGVDPNYPPYESIDEEGRYFGIIPDYLELITQRLGVQWEKIIESTFKALTDRARNKSLDLLPGVVVTPERSQFLLFTRTYEDGLRMIVTRKDSPPINSVADLSGTKVALVKSHASAEIILKRQPELVPVYVDTALKALEAVAVGKADAAIGGGATLSYLIRKIRLGNLRLNAFTAMQGSKFAMGVRDDWPILASILDKALASITPQEHQEISNRWIDLGAESKDANVIELTAEEIKWLNDNPVIRVAVDAHRAPIAFINEQGAFRGIVFDYLQWLEQKLEVKFEAAADPTMHESDNGVKRGEFLMFAAANRTPENETYLSFTDIYLSIPHVIFAGPDVPYIGGLNELGGQQVAVLKGHAIDKILADKHPNIQRVTKDDLSEALRSLARGKVYVLIGDMLTISHSLVKLGYTQIKIVGETPYRDDLAMASRSDQPILGAILQKAIAAMSEAEHNTIKQRWSSIKYEQAFDYSLLWKVLIPAILIVIAATAWNWKLASEARRRRAAEKSEYKAKLAIENLNQILQQKNSELEAYNHTIAHGLKTSLAATGRFLEILTKFKADTLSEEQQHLAEQALFTVNMSGEVVDALLTLSTVSHEQIEQEPLNMEQIVQQALALLQDEQDRIHVQVKLASRWPHAIGYAPWVGEVWINYISNAFKYSNNPAKVELGGAPDGVNNIRFWVRSNGDPLTEDECERIFTPFTRLHEEQGPGHGLGLTIVQRIIEKLGGRAGVNPISGTGNEFFFTLPATNASPK